MQCVYNVCIRSPPAKIPYAILKGKLKKFKVFYLVKFDFRKILILQQLTLLIPRLLTICYIDLQVQAPMKPTIYEQNDAMCLSNCHADPWRM